MNEKENIKEKLPEDIKKVKTVSNDGDVALNEKSVDNVSEKEPVETEIINEQPFEDAEEDIYDSQTRVKKYLEKPLSKKEKKRRKLHTKKYEKEYEKKQYHAKEKKTLRFKVMFGLLITLGIILLFRYILKIDMTLFFERMEIPSMILSGVLVVFAFYLVMSDKAASDAEPDPITDFFIINKGKIGGRTKKNLQNRINTRFIMITLLKLFKKDQIAIVNERFIYGAMGTQISKDEVAVLDFLLDNQIITLDDFLDVFEAENPVKYLGVLGKIDNFYERYKESIIEMAHDKKYVNQSINKAKFVLRTGGLVASLIVIALLAKGQGTLVSLGIYTLEAAALFLIANFIHARSKGAHTRIAEIRKRKKILQSPKEDVYTALIYNYLFGKEERILKKINKYHQDGTMQPSEYAKFSETYNGFNYLLDYLKNDYSK